MSALLVRVIPENLPGACRLEFGFAVVPPQEHRRQSLLAGVGSLPVSSPSVLAQYEHVCWERFMGSVNPCWSVCPPTVSLPPPAPQLSGLFCGSISHRLQSMCKRLSQETATSHDGSSRCERFLPKCSPQTPGLSVLTHLGSGPDKVYLYYLGVLKHEQLGTI